MGSKPAWESMTLRGLAVVLVGVAAQWLEYDVDDAIAQQTVDTIIQTVSTAIALAGTITAAIGRLRAVQRIR